jgi:hypothetical protein
MLDKLMVGQLVARLVVKLAGLKALKLADSLVVQKVA